MIENRIAVVTGGTRGIGRAIASSLVGAGVQVAITGRHEKDVAEAASQLNERGKAMGYICDVRDYDQVRSMFGRVTEDFGGLDILINNAGVGIFASVESMSIEDFRAVLETNVCGVFYCCHEAIPMMKRRGGGYIINISSLAGANPHANMAAYNASKFGLNGFSEALMQEVRHDGIKVSYIMPGSFPKSQCYFTRRPGVMVVSQDHPPSSTPTIAQGGLALRLHPAPPRPVIETIRFRFRFAFGTPPATGVALRPYPRRGRLR
jgi:NAD(P)-dependent dehydrogenase (short-subunit alcohol dehydrogenase family)